MEKIIRHEIHYYIHTYDCQRSYLLSFTSGIDCVANGKAPICDMRGMSTDKDRKFDDDEEYQMLVMG